MRDAWQHHSLFPTPNDIHVSVSTKSPWQVVPKRDENGNQIAEPLLAEPEAPQNRKFCKIVSYGLMAVVLVSIGLIAGLAALYSLSKMTSLSDDASFRSSVKSLCVPGIACCYAQSHFHRVVS